MRIVSFLSASARSTRTVAFFAFLCLLTLSITLPVAAQSSVKAHVPAAQKKTAVRKTKRTSVKPAQTALVPAVVPVLPPQPPKPNWPVNDKPFPPSIAWNASGLRIEASNSSLQQILKEVSALTGSSIEGVGPDERVYGTYGPGPVREVLPKLLYGSGYNLLLIGDLGQGTPRRIVLSFRGGAGKTLAAAPHPMPSDDDDVDDVEEEQPQQGQPPQVHNNLGGQPGQPQQSPEQ